MYISFLCTLRSGQHSISDYGRQLTHWRFGVQATALVFRRALRAVIKDIRSVISSCNKRKERHRSMSLNK